MSIVAEPKQALQDVIAPELRANTQSMADLKDDVAHLRADGRDDVGHLRNDIANVRPELAASESRTRAEASAMESRLQGSILALESRLMATLSAMRADMRSDVTVATQLALAEAETSAFASPAALGSAPRRAFLLPPATKCCIAPDFRTCQPSKPPVPSTGMPSLSATDAIGLAFAHTREVLAAPRFRLLRFYKLALVAALTQATFLSLAGVYPLQGAQFAAFSRMHRLGAQQFVGGGAFAAVGIVFLLAAAAIGILISLGLLYLFCRVRVTLFDLVVERGGRVRAAWRRHPRAARRYFALYLLVMLAWLCVLAATLGPFFVAFLRGSLAATRAGGAPGTLPAAMASQVLVLAGLSWLLLPLWLALDALLQDFILPSLALEPEASIGGAFRRLAALARRSPGQLLLFLLLRMLVAFGIGLALMLVTLVIVGLFGLAAFGIGKLLYAGLWTGGIAARTLFFAVAAGLALLVYALYLVAVIAVYGVTGVFKTSYAALFFAGYYPTLAAHLNPPPEIPPAYTSPLPQQLW